MTCFFMDSFESRMNPRFLAEGDVVRAKSNRVREGNSGRFQGRRKGKEKSLFCRWIFKKLVTHVQPHASAVSLLKRAENSVI